MRAATAGGKLLSYLSPKVKIGQSFQGKGLFAQEKIRKGEIVIDYTHGKAKFVSTAEAVILYEQGNDYMIQVDDDLFFAARNEEEVEEADFLNHSCDPNCGIKGSLQIVARRPIQPQEEITIDYAMCESSEYSIDCRCGTAQCRKVITGDDWKRKELQQRYQGFFSKYLERKMEKECGGKCEENDTSRNYNLKNISNSISIHCA